MAASEATGNEVAVIRARDLGREFRGMWALKGVDLSLAKGETLGVIGPNGAGKTTLVRVLTGQIPPSSGEIYCDGKAVDPARAGFRMRIGLVPQEASFYGRLTARENLALLARLYGLPKERVAARVEELLAWSGLREHAARQVRFFSRGMQQRLSLAMGMVHGPEIVFLDEPTSGLDPEARSAVWELILRLREEGRTVLMTTHNMEEADHLCTRLAILVRGEIREQGTPREIKSLLGADRVELRLSEERRGELEELCASLGINWKKEGEIYVLTGVDLAAKLPAVISRLAVGLRDLHYREVTLEDAFLRFMREVEG
jgi:ABC-2 type transport system ATP-binding protein